MGREFYVTTPIYYVNAEPHIGHAYTTIVADFLKRFYNMLGYDAYFLTGTDEHGDKILKAALQGESTPEEYADRISDLFKKTWNDIGIEFDDFIRTTEKRHIRVVQNILQKVYDNGDIYFGKYGGDYCVGCERFLTEKDIVDGKCPDHDNPLEYIEENNYFFKMSRYQNWLLEHIKESPDFIRPERYKNEVISLLEMDVLEDLCISRPKKRLSWGVTLPFDRDYVTYVWFDALINYISGIGYPDDKRFKKYWPVSHHLIAKDILKPHGIFWPIMLRAAGLEPYRHLNVHGYWNIEEAKMSKTIGNVVSPSDLVSKYGNDQIRYFFLREMTFGMDARFSEDAIINRINYDLGNDLGNLIRRTFNMIFKYFQGKIPHFYSDNHGDRDELKQMLESAVDGYISNISNFQFNVGIERLWQFIRYLNKYIDKNKPWQLYKEERTELLSSVMRNILESIYSIAILLSPICINTSPKIIDALNCDDKIRDPDVLSLSALKGDEYIKQMEILFPRLTKEEEVEVGVNSQKGEMDSEKDEGVIDIRDFAKVDIRVAKIIDVSKIEGSEKLLQLEVDSGLDRRTIIAGIAKYYSPEYLVGKKILLVINLKAVTIFKRKSYGMLLAAKSEGSEKPILIEIDDNIPLGAKLS